MMVKFAHDSAQIVPYREQIFCIGRKYCFLLASLHLKKSGDLKLYKMSPNQKQAIT